MILSQNFKKFLLFLVKMIKLMLMILFFISIINSQIISELPDELLDPADIADYNQQQKQDSLSTLLAGDDQFMTIILNFTVNKSGKDFQYSSALGKIFKKTIESIVDSFNFL